MAPAVAFEEYALSPIDRTHLSNYVRCQFFFATHDAAGTVDRIRTGMERLINELPFLSGNITLSQADSTGREVLTIRPRETWHIEDVFKVQKHDDVSVREVLCRSHESQEKQQMPRPPMVDLRQSMSVLVVQVNTYTDGVLLSLAIAHMACDATGLGTLIQNFAACCREQESEDSDPEGGRLTTGLEKEAAARRLLFRGPTSTPTPRDNPTFMKAYTELESYTARCERIAAALSQPTKVQLSNYHFSVAADKLEGLKAVCNRLLSRPMNKEDNEGLLPSTGNSCPRWVSSNDVLVALIWMCLTRARFPHINRSDRLDKQTATTTTLTLAVNLRRRLSPPLPDTYMGNAAMGLVHTLDLQAFSLDASSEHEQTRDHLVVENTTPLAGILNDHTTKTLCDIAHSIRTSLTATTADYLDEWLSYLTNAPKYVTLAVGVADLLVSSWRDVGFCDADFGPGLGRPVRMRRFDVGVEGMTYILPKRCSSVDGRAAWEFQITLNEETLAGLMNDPLWCACVGGDDFWG